jgi:hypothetical protein
MKTNIPAFRLASARIGAPILAVALLLAGCDGEKITGTTTETVSGKTTGIIRLADGKAASAARVRVLPVGYRPASDSGRSIAFQTVTDKEGRYFIDSLAAGEYNLLSDLKGQSGYQDSVFLSGSARTLDTVSLSDPGYVAGYVALEPGDPPITVIVQALGTLAFANVNAKGFFQLPALPAGEYTVAVSTSLDSYTTGYYPIAVRAGRRDTLADTLRPLFSGIPQVTGLKVAYDTLNGVARLSWNRSDYPYLRDYLVYRDPGQSGSFGFSSPIPVKDTFYVDTLFRNPFTAYGDRSVPAPDSAMNVQYQIGIRNEFGAPGRLYGVKEVLAVSPAQIFTFGTISFPGFPNGVATPNDTVRVAVHFENRGRRIKRIRWEAARFAIAPRVFATDTHAGNDTLVFIAPPQPEYGTFYANLTDDGGFEWTIAANFSTVAHPPKVTLTAPSLVRFGDSLALSGVGETNGSRIVKWEWDFGATGSYRAASRPDSVLVADSAWVHYPVVLRATDEDGLSGQDTAWLYVSRWKSARSLPAQMQSTFSAVLDGKIYVAEKKTSANWAQKFYAYDPATDAWEWQPDMPVPVTNGALTAGEGKVYLIAKIPSVGIYAYDPASRTWENLAPPNYIPYDFSAVYSAGTIRIIGGMDDGGNHNSTDIYDYRIATNSWSNQHVDFAFTAWNGSWSQVVAAEGAYYALLGMYGNSGPIGNLQTLTDPSPSATIRLKSVSTLTWNTFYSNYPPSLAASEGTLYLLEPDVVASQYIMRFYAYSIAAGIWKEYDPMPAQTHVGNLLAIGKRVYAMGTTQDPSHLDWIDLK